MFILFPSLFVGESSVFYEEAERKLRFEKDNMLCSKNKKNFRISRAPAASMGP